MHSMFVMSHRKHAPRGRWRMPGLFADNGIRLPGKIRTGIDFQLRWPKGAAMTGRSTITLDEIRANALDMLSKNGSVSRVSHQAVLNEVLHSLEQIDFQALAGLESEKGVTHKHLRVLTVKEVLRVAKD